MAAIEVHGLTKRYGEVLALDDLDLTVEEGEIFGFLGPNGAGKSTTIDVLLDFVRPTAGRAEVLGFDAQRQGSTLRQRVGVLPDDFHVYDRLTGRQHLAFVVESKRAADDPDALLDRVGILDAADRRAGEYSSGMKQRLALGMALVGEPDLLVLDEPTTGLDPRGAREMRDLVREERARGATVFFSSHILGQVEAVCDRVGILRDGHLVAEDSIEGLRETIHTDATLSLTVDRVPNGALDALRSLGGVSNATADEGVVTVTCTDRAKADAVRALQDAGATVEDLDTRDASLEELFMTYTTEETETEAATA